MSRFRFAIVLHNHQPVGNFDGVMAQAQQQAYRPFLEHARRHPGIKFSFHQSGILWSFQEDRDPGFFRLIRDGIADGQIELLGGGFAEPILISIPEEDAIAQIRRLDQYLHEQFGVRPNGAWLTERIWEPHLPALLAKAGITHLPLDDTHFLYAGLSPEELHQSFLTEQLGQTLTVIPSQKELRYLIPFGRVDEVIGYLKQTAEKFPDGCVVYADDGEKFGVWPKTFDHCYTNGWIGQFFEALDRESGWLETVHLSALAAPSGQRVYLPSASYAEMLQWALPAGSVRRFEDFEHWLTGQGKKEAYGSFVRGGHWRGFLTKYPEVNLLHKKMLRVSARLAALKESTKNWEHLERIRTHLHAAQCNCPYWHGIFGGIYLPHIRKAVFAELLTAEKLLRGLERQKGTVMQSVDADLDGFDDLLIETSHATAMISPAQGGMLVEYSIFEPACHLLDTIARREEGYHRQLQTAAIGKAETASVSIHDQVRAKETGLEKLLTVDPYLKRSFIEHLFSLDESAVAFSENRADSLFCSVGQPGTQVIQDDGLDLHFTAQFAHAGGNVRFTLSKQMKVQADGSVDVRYQLSTDRPVTVRFASEHNLTFQAGHADDRYVLINGRFAEPRWLDGNSDTIGVRTVSLVDEWQGGAAELTAAPAAELWRAPIFTVSLSEDGFEKVYQGTTLVLTWTLELSSEPTTLSIGLRGGKIDKSFPARNH